jgi:MYXO-CTERM domain-containing protein
MKFTKSWATAAATVALTGAAQAALVLQANGLEVLDTNTNLIWLKDWNRNGTQNWATQKAWAETTLDGFAGSNDWRLPGIAEYADLFTAYGDLTSNTLPFVNVVRELYWSGTELAPGVSARLFQATSGLQTNDVQRNLFFAVAVRPGDVPASVPEPQTLALALLALGATAVARRRRSA